MRGQTFRFHTPTRLLFGDRVSERIGDHLAERNIESALLVTDAGLESAGMADGIREWMRKAGIRVASYSGVVPNPTVQNVHEGCRLLREEGCRGVVALGGGSPIDAAKAISMLSVHEGNITDYEVGGKPVVKAGPPLFAVPTTAGTGSEVTFGAVLTDQKTHRKFDVKSVHLAPSVSLVDPLLTLSLPPPITAATGMDALCHAVEAYVTRDAGPLTDALAIHAVELIGRNLLCAYRDGSDLVARRGMMLASLMAGMAFANAGLGAVHGLSAPLSGRFGISHGVANAIMLPFVMAFNLETRKERFSRISLALGCAQKAGAAGEPRESGESREFGKPSESCEPRESGKPTAPAGLSASSEPDASAAVARVREMNRLLGIPSLSSCGVTEGALEELVADALHPSSNCRENPRSVAREDALVMYRDALWVRDSTD